MEAQFKKAEQFKKELVSLLKKYDAELRGYDKPVWPEQDPERGVMVKFSWYDDVEYGGFINGDGSDE